MTKKPSTPLPAMPEPDPETWARFEQAVRNVARVKVPPKAAPKKGAKKQGRKRTTA